MMYRLNAVLDKEIDKLILKLTCKTKGPRLAKRLLKERKKKKKGTTMRGLAMKGVVNLVYYSILIFLLLAWDM